MAGRASKKGLGLLGFRCEDGQAFALELISQEKCIGDIGLVAVDGRLIVFETPLSLER